MSNFNEDALDAFLGNEPKRTQEPSEPSKPKLGNEKKMLDQREGLIERVDKVFVTKDGKQLLREHY
jgi:hypothetical protein